jgi:hypothetical protein
MPSHTSIGTSVNKGTEDRSGCMIGEVVRNRGRIDAPIESPLNRNNLILGTGRSSIGNWSSRSLGTG